MGRHISDVMSVCEEVTMYTLTVVTTDKGITVLQDTDTDALDVAFNNAKIATNVVLVSIHNNHGQLIRCGGANNF